MESWRRGGGRRAKELDCKKNSTIDSFCVKFKKRSNSSILTHMCVQCAYGSKTGKKKVTGLRDSTSSHASYTGHLNPKLLLITAAPWRGALLAG
jgi:uncharacterized protein YlaI